MTPDATTVTRNLYLESATAPPPTEPLSGEARAEVAIVGGGYTGLSTALHLAEAGVRAVLVEAEALGHGCSGRNGGQVNPGLKPDPDEVEADWGRDLGRRMVALSYAAPDEVFALVERLGIDCAASRTGTVRAAVTAPAEAAVAKLYEQCRARGMPVDLLGAEAARARTGTDRYRSALLDRRGGHLNPLSYARGLAKAAIEAGAKLHDRSPALAVERSGGGWLVRTKGGSVAAETVVIGTNGYTGDLWPGLAQTIVPVFSAIAATGPLPPALRAAIMPGRSSLYEIGWDTVYYRLDDAGRLLMGGRGPQRPETSPADFDHLLRYAERLFPALRGQDWPYRWSGRVAVTTDHYPHLNEPEPGLYTMLGYNGRGVAMATVAGRLIARRIASKGREPIDLPVGQGLKPIPFHAFRRVGIEARIVYGRVRDRLGV
ncbi:MULTISPECIES: NAD(P)/FAD-dependent oxidoreductase [unclassified Aureimonas]|uniref:NAD(P)/FAD-dependent oxidoreductase n=1 Tax=unclassified Aureimonas TaxID=2615206 RepID=UPI00070204CA|nr:MULTISPECIES: FAD-dependent oxidoreductase [unclassified Aureimonas]KQT68951.1 oxidoreductase [Aureimonas sp. Leaf460]KQT69179.1 oxidoreductase [Aureimonas sp. Leaf427]